MWDFNNIFLINTVYYTLIFYGEYWFIRLVSQEKSKRSNSWLIYLVFGGILAFVTTSATITGGSAELLLFAAIIFNNVISLFLHRYIFVTLPKRIIYFLALLVNLFFSIFQNIFSVFDTFITGWFEFNYTTFTIYSIVQGVGYFLLLLLTFWGISKTGLLFALRKIFLYPNAAFVISLVVAVPQFAFNSLFANLEDPALMYGAYFISYAILLLFYVFLFREYLREERLKNSEALVLQQNVYVDRLEGIQQELRRIHHDYKNVATGLYAQVESGDLEAAQEYISKQLLQMDQGLQVSIQQLNQLTNIHVIELKTLIMTKITEAEKRHVKLVVEVMTPVTSVPMEIVDLLRCGGILLDNAIEAAVQEAEKKVTVVLLKEQDRLAFVVKNPLSKAVDMQRIWTEGYSTKGNDRGLGLANLKEITQRYPNVWLETRLEEQNFVQILNFKG